VASSTRDARPVERGRRLPSLAEPVWVGRLSPGPGLPAEEVRAHQRYRLRRAAIELTAARGIERLTLRGLCRTAGVSTGSFYRCFTDLEDCCGSTGEALVTCALRRAAARRIEGETEGWRSGLRAAGHSLLVDAAAQPAAARFTLVELSVAGPATRRRGGVGAARIERFLGEILDPALGMTKLPPRLLVGIGAGTLRVARKTALAGRAAELPGVSRALTGWIEALADEGVRRLGDVGPGRAARRHESGPFLDRWVREPVATTDERGRILEAMTRLAERDGYWALCVTSVRREARVSRRSFDTCFADLDECYLEAIEASLAAALRNAACWAGEGGTPGMRVYRATLAICAQLARDRRLARLALLDILAPGRSGLLRREHLVSLGAACLREWAPELADDEVSTEASVAAAWRIAAEEIAAGRVADLPHWAPLLAYLAVAPISGAGQAIIPLITTR